MGTRSIAITSLTIDGHPISVERGALELVQHDSELDGTREWSARLDGVGPLPLEGGLAVLGTDEGDATGEVVVLLGDDASILLQGSGILEGVKWL